MYPSISLTVGVPVTPVPVIVWPSLTPATLANTSTLEFGSVKVNTTLSLILWLEDKSILSASVVLAGSSVPILVTVGVPLIKMVHLE